MRQLGEHLIKDAITIRDDTGTVHWETGQSRIKEFRKLIASANISQKRRKIIDNLLTEAWIIQEIKKLKSWIVTSRNPVKAEQYRGYLAEKERALLLLRAKKEDFS